MPQWRVPKYGSSQKSTWCQKFGHGVGLVEGAGTLRWPPGRPRRVHPGPKWDHFRPQMAKNAKMTMNFQFLSNHGKSMFVIILMGHLGTTSTKVRARARGGEGGPMGGQ